MGRVVDGFDLHLDYAPSASNAPRWRGAPLGHPILRTRIEAAAPRYVELLASIGALGPTLRPIAADLPEEDPRPRWSNPMIAGLDACAIGAFLSKRPRLYLEVGSGHSTRFARHFVRAFGAATKIVSIDPAPRTLCDSLCDEVFRQPVEAVDLAVFRRLLPGDVLFFDGSHRSFMNSDATVLFLDVLPRLPPGIVVGIHDIFLPEDYPAEWADRYYNEEYLLAAYLLGVRDRVEILFPAHFVWTSESRPPEFNEARRSSGCPEPLFHGCSFWFTHASA